MEISHHFKPHISGFVAYSKAYKSLMLYKNLELRQYKNGLAKHLENFLLFFFDARPDILEDRQYCIILFLPALDDTNKVHSQKKRWTLFSLEVI